MPMRGVHIHVRAGTGSGLSGKLFGILAGGVMLTCILLFLAGLWLLLAVSVFLVLIAGLLRALLFRQARKKALGGAAAGMGSSDAFIKATQLSPEARDPTVSKDVSSESSPTLRRPE